MRPAAILALLALSACAAGQRGRVVRVVDGDTLVVRVRGVDERVRLIGVDTPETVHPRRPVECFGPEASAAARDLLDGRRVRLERDALAADRDRYGRLLRHVRVEGEQAGEALLAGGFARALTSWPTERAERHVAIEAEARAAGAGMWSACP